MTKDDYLEKIPEELKEYGESVLDSLTFLKKHLNELQKLPFIEVHPTRPEKQRQTVAAKQYHDYLQSYNNMLVVFMKLMNFQNINGAESSALEEGLNKIVELMSRTPNEEE